MEIQLSPLVIRQLKKIKHYDKKLAEKVEKHLLTFKSNPKHPSLRLHKLTGKKERAWSISITMNIRLIYKLVDNNTAYFTNLGTHDEVYRK
jgi:addiction module RelE/StbE family toxin